MHGTQHKTEKELLSRVDRIEPVPPAVVFEDRVITAANDDWATIAAIGILAYMAANILHEGFGHGGVALLSGARHIVVTTVSMNTSLDTRWIDAAGTLINLFAALILWPVLTSTKIRSVHTRYCLILMFAFNLFTGTGYFLFSGITGFGDWEGVIQGQHPQWLWRTLLVILGAVSYYLAMRLVGSLLRPFLGELAGGSPRCRRLTITPYISAAAIAAVAGLFNPLGLPLLWESALPSTLGANFGLLKMDRAIRRPISNDANPGAIDRSFPWIGAAVFLGLLYALVLGPGVHITR